MRTPKKVPRHRWQGKVAAMASFKVSTIELPLFDPDEKEDAEREGDADPLLLPPLLPLLPLLPVVLEKEERTADRGRDADEDDDVDEDEPGLIV